MTLYKSHDFSDLNARAYSKDISHFPTNRLHVYIGSPEEIMEIYSVFNELPKLSFYKVLLGQRSFGKLAPQVSGTSSFSFVNN